MNKKLLKDNRGAALVSVMIAVAFIAILGSSLLYMSYSNYKMKVANYESKVNFYGTEHDMTVLSSGIRNGIVNASGDPLEELKTIIGYNEDTGRYNPASLAKVVYEDSVVTDVEAANYYVYVDEERNDVTYPASADMEVTFSTGIPAASGANVIIEDDPEEIGVKKVTLKSVVIMQEDYEGKYTNKITTDLVYRIKEETTLQDPGGVGEFSMISDTPINAKTSLPARLIMYGNVFIASGVYEYDGDGNPKPSSNGENPALHLAGDTVFTLVGDYMIVYGDIVLEENAVLNIMSGNLTVLGDVYVNDNSCFLCSGDVYFPPGEKVDQDDVTRGYGVTTKSSLQGGGEGNVGNVVPASLMEEDGINVISDTNYQNLVSTLGLSSGDVDDGVLAQLFDMSGDFTIEDYDTNDERKGDWINVEKTGMGYRGFVYEKGDAVNKGYFDNSLIFLTGDGDVKMNDGGSMHATFVCLNNVEYVNQKSYRFSQIGSDVFNYLIDEDTDYELPKPGGGKVKLHDLFTDDPNEVMNNIIGYGTDNENGEPEILAAVGYVNWTKE